MYLSSLLEVLGKGEFSIQLESSKDPPIERVVHDSRGLVTGGLFCCVSGMNYDGHDYANAAIRAGAVAVLTEKKLILDIEVPVVVVSSVRKAMPHLASALAGNPSQKLEVVGVTGTNGKTSVTHMLTDVLNALGRTSKSIGTLSGPRTTPEAPEFQESLAMLGDEGAEYVVVEVSSHALAQHRVDSTRFAAVAFTNLGRDHLDYHSTIEDYAAAKDRLFTREFSHQAVIVVDDEAGRTQANRARAAGLKVVEVRPSSVDSTVGWDMVEFQWRNHRVRVPIGGRFTIANALVVAELGLLLGFESVEIVSALEGVRPVPGRFETLDVIDSVDVVVDYAHTPDALRDLLASCRDIARGRTILVFGCGGERDIGKRPLMGFVAEAGADLVVVTSDNPRGEPPSAVIADILLGMKETPTVVEPDRRGAIRSALSIAEPNDLVVVAGRGHETIQTVAGKQIPFEDRLVIAEEARQIQLKGTTG